MDVQKIVSDVSPSVMLTGVVSKTRCSQHRNSIDFDDDFFCENNEFYVLKKEDGGTCTENFECQSSSCIGTKCQYEK